MTVDTFETRRPNASPRVTTVLRFATRTPSIPVTVDTVETRRPSASPKTTTVLRFATTMLPIPVAVDTFGKLNVRSDDSSAFRHGLRLPKTRDTRGRWRTPAGACERLRAQTQRLWSPPGPLDPNLKTGTLLRRRKKL